jgi:molecular chaperone DnaK
MMKDAEAHAADDAARKDGAEARNQADHTAYQIDKQLAEHGDKLTDDERSALEGKVKEVRDLLANSNADAKALEKATEELMTESQILGQKVYEASQTPEPGSDEAGSADTPADDDDVVEAEIVEEDEES